MSLDVYLHMVIAPGHRPAGSGIFVREDGATKEITREQWDQCFPGREPIVANLEADEREVYSANITHNLGEMAAAAGIYKALWRPEEIGITKAKELIVPLADGLAMLRVEPEKFKALNPKNGWGNYEGLVRFVARYLAACREWPDAEVSVSR